MLIKVAIVEITVLVATKPALKEESILEELTLATVTEMETAMVMDTATPTSLIMVK
jgi:hypothetical protein